MPRLNPILYYVVYCQGIVAGVTIAPGIYGVLVGEYKSFIMIIYGVTIGFIVFFLKIFCRPSRPLTLEDAILIAVASWTLVPILSAIPISLYLGLPFIDSWFEAVSGFTTTGLTMFSGTVDKDFNTYIPSVEELPRSVLFWRSLIQWIGGLGILVVLTALALSGGLPSHLVGFAEGRYERLEPSLARSLRRLLIVYLFLTLLAAILFYSTGMPPFDAINHAMTALATGGFSTHSNSIGYYDDPVLEGVVVLAMIWGATNFATHYKILFKGSLRAPLNDPELRMFVLLAVIGSLATTYTLYSKSHYDITNALRYAVFQFISAMTGTGFQTTSLTNVPDETKFILTVACLIGGSYLSTTGGIKIYRLLVATYTISWTTKRVANIRGIVIKYRIGTKPLDFEELMRNVSIIFSFAILWALGTIATLMTVKTNLANAGLEAASALGTVGVSSGITGAHIPLTLKLIYIALMSLGRLEIIPYIMAMRILISRTKLFLKTKIEERTTNQRTPRI
ncbi:MAG TPA: TrkH family potassium uptake protein [Pyrodictium sp.]|nr:TrkH family potassium uptake protein [Pyrodictium sp.]